MASTVEVQVSRMPTGFAQCRVMDRGPGVPEEARARLFTRFLSVAKASERSEYSSGLGLAIAREFVLAHHGNITISDNGTRGARFCISIPAEPFGNPT